jgi:hypothetical protein
MATGVQDVDQAFAGGVTRDGMVGRSASRTFGFSPLSNAFAAQSVAAFGSGLGMGLGRQGFGMGGMGFGGMGFGGMGFGGMGGFGNQNRMNGGQQANQRTIRTRLLADFGVQAVAPVGERRTAIVTRMQKLPAGARFAGTNIDMDGRTAILRGTVATDRDRRLAERLLMLEPGVDSVRNELTVTEP